MPKPFAVIVVPFTPKWNKNRERDKADQFIVNLRDFPEKSKLAYREELAQVTPAGSGNPREESIASIAYVKKDLDIAERVVRERVASVDGLQITDEGGKVIDIKTGADIIEHCSSLMKEIANRLFNGADEEELKN